MPINHPAIVESKTDRSTWPMEWRDEDDTRQFAARLAMGLDSWPGARDACLDLQGDLGSGKTTLVRHLLRAAGVTGRIKSPTYAVLEPHTAGSAQAPWPVWHFDFYRFSDPREWEDAGFREIFAGPGLKLVEWSEKVAGQLPVADLIIRICVEDENKRKVQVNAGTARAQSWLEELGADGST
jgi:tRNA threonylcarbamoyladenosine biosynthesis protein TsaE